MALSADRLAERVRDAWEADGDIPFEAGDETAERAIFHLCQAIVDELVEAADVVDVSVDPNSGDQLGSGAIE